MLFLAGVVVLLIDAIRAGNLLGIVGSLLFLFGVVLFLAPLAIDRLPGRHRRPRPQENS